MHFEMHFPTPRKNEFFSKSKMLQRYYLFLNITKKKKREYLFTSFCLYFYLHFSKIYQSPT